MAWQFEVGKDVVCISNTWGKPHGPTIIGAPPVEGRIYKVADILPLPEFVHRFLGPAFECTERGADRVVLQLTEYPPTVYFDAENFRPVRDTDITELQALLVPVDSVKRQVDNREIVT